MVDAHYKSRTVIINQTVKSIFLYPLINPGYTTYLYLNYISWLTERRLKQNQISRIYEPISKILSYNKHFYIPVFLLSIKKKFKTIYLINNDLISSAESRF